MTIIISRAGKHAKKIEESGVENEDYLQRYIFENPESLPIDEIKEDVRLMVIAREFPAGSGSIDVLAIDEDGEIYIIETKLFKNPDKRLVVAQVLDYGAALWNGYADPMEFIGAIDSRIIERTGRGLVQELVDILEITEEDAGPIIDNVKSNLRAGNFRFVVLMDKLHDPLKHLIIFINQRSALNIYAVEMEFYRHDDLEIIIPKLFGAEVKKTVGSASARTARRWNKSLFLSELEAQANAECAHVAEELIDWISPKVTEVKWGVGQKSGSFAPIVNVNGTEIRLFYLWTTGAINFSIEPWVEKTCFRDQALLERFLDKLNLIPGIEVSPQEIKNWTKHPLSALTEKTALEQFKAAIAFVLKQLARDDRILDGE